MSRKSTFSALEINKLFEICGKYAAIIEGKKTDCIKLKDKEDAWEKIAEEFNATNVIIRECKELKKKYKNIKFSTKNKAAEERKSVYGTGGGPATTHTLTGPEEWMLSMLNEKEMDGIPNSADSDAVKEDQAEINDNSQPNLETPAPGPATLRKKMSTPLWTPQKQGEKNNKSTSWEHLASIKSKWTEAKLQAEVSLAKKEEERVELQMKIMRERHELDVLQCKERQALEMEILNIRFQKVKLELKKLYAVQTL